MEADAVAGVVLGLFVGIPLGVFAGFRLAVWGLTNEEASRKKTDDRQQDQEDQEGPDLASRFEREVERRKELRRAGTVRKPLGGL